MDTFVSIIVPVYNGRKYLESCINSILQQDLKQIEIILIDDGSSDESGIICDYMTSKDRRIRVVHTINGGAANARNIGIKLASGIYLGFVDSDDWVENKMFSTMYKCAEENNADIVWCNAYNNDSEKLKKYIQSKVYQKNDIEKEIFPRLISIVDEHNSDSVLRGSVWIRLFRKSLIEDNNILFPACFIYNEDILFSVQATIAANTYVYLGDQYLYHKRVVYNSITRRYIHNLWDTQKEIYNYLKNVTNGCRYDFLEQVYKKYFEVAIYCIENECKIPLNIQFYKKVRIICEDTQLRTAMDHVCFRNLSQLKKCYYIGVKCKRPLLLWCIVKWRYRTR